MSKLKTAGAFVVGAAGVIGVIIAVKAYQESHAADRGTATVKLVEKAATDFIDGDRDSHWAESGKLNYDFPLDRYHNLKGPVDEAEFLDGDARLWRTAESLEFTVLGATVVEQASDGSFKVNVDFDAVRFNKADSGRCHEERAKKVMRLLLVKRGGAYKIKAEDDNSAPYACVD